VAEDERQAEGFVEDAGKGVGGVKSDGGEEWVYLLLKEFDGELAIGFTELFPGEHGDASKLEFGDEAVVPAGTLIVGEQVELGAEAVHALILRQSTCIYVRGEADSFLELLQDTGNSNLNELVEVTGGDGEKLDALEERIGGVVGLF
jgi:hypothetical protein